MMIKPKHTPGPWLLIESTVYALNDDGTNRFYAVVQRGFIIQTRNLTTRTPDHEIKANARLMCAAPQLLEALVSTINYLELLDDRSKSISFIETARGLIAEVTGEA